MTGLLVHPSRGSKDGRVNLKRSLEVQVPFTQGPVGAALTPVEREQLLLRHPSGEAHFWGTYAHNAAKIARVHEGDVVIFTGQGHAWAVGVVGYRFDNPAFAQALWQETAGKGTYRYIYALAQFEMVDIPYATLNAALGHKLNNHFQAMAVYDTDGQAERVIEALHLNVRSAPGLSYTELDDQLADALADEIGGSTLLPIELVHTLSTTTTVTAGERVVRRGEGSLVQAYAASLPGGVEFGRHRVEAGMTDLCAFHPEGMELVEAKSDASRAYVRQALAQLLDYAPSMDSPPTVVSALFPIRPEESCIRLLNRYGVDCLYREGPGDYRRVAASADARDRLLAFWDAPAGK